LIFDSYHDGYHTIDIYVRVCRYEIKDGQAFEITAKGRRRVTVRYAQERVDAWKKREAKTLTMGPPTRRQMWLFLIGFALLSASSVAAFWWLMR